MRELGSPAGEGSCNIHRPPLAVGVQLALNTATRDLPAAWSWGICTFFISSDTHTHTHTQLVVLHASHGRRRQVKLAVASLSVRPVGNGCPWSVNEEGHVGSPTCFTAVGTRYQWTGSQNVTATLSPSMSVRIRTAENPCDITLHLSANSCRPPAFKEPDSTFVKCHNHQPLLAPSALQPLNDTLP